MISILPPLLNKLKFFTNILIKLVRMKKKKPGTTNNVEKSRQKCFFKLS